MSEPGVTLRDALQDLLDNEGCACRRTLSAGQCPRCELAFNNAKAALATPPQVPSATSEVSNILKEVCEILGVKLGPGLARYAPLIQRARELAHPADAPPRSPAQSGLAQKGKANHDKLFEAIEFTESHVNEVLELKNKVPQPLQQKGGRYDEYASYANHCAIQKKVPMTWHSWKREQAAQPTPGSERAKKHVGFPKED
jgi:hypothetical protein